MVRKVLALVLLATLAACASNITAVDEGENRGGTMVIGGG
jgi:hypothetical protein